MSKCMQNKIRKLLPMILCLIMALSIATGMGNFALADEIVDGKNDGERVIKSFKVFGSEPEKNLLKTYALGQEPPSGGGGGGSENLYPDPVITDASVVDEAYPVSIISSDLYYGNQFYLQFTGLANKENYQVTLTGAGLGDEGLAGEITGYSEDYNWNIEEPVKGVLFDIPEDALFYGENVLINIQVTTRNGEGAGLFLSPAQIQTKFVIDTGRAYGGYFRAQVKELSLDAVIPGYIAEGTKVNAYLLNSQNEIVAADAQRYNKWDEIYFNSHFYDVDPRYEEVFGDFGIDDDETRAISREEINLSNIRLYKMGDIPAGQYNLNIVTEDEETFIIPDAINVVDGAIINSLEPGYDEGYPQPTVGGDTLYVKVEVEGALKDDLNLVVKDEQEQAIGNTVGSRYLYYYSEERVSCVYKLELEKGTVFAEDQEYYVEITRKDGGALYNAENNAPLYPIDNFTIYRHSFNHGLVADFTFKSVNAGGKTYILSLTDYSGELSTVEITPRHNTFTVQFIDPENKPDILQLEPGNDYRIIISVEDDGNLEEIDQYWFDTYDYEDEEDIYIPEVIMDEMKTYLKETDTSGAFAFDFAILVDEFDVDAGCRFKVALSLPDSNNQLEVEGDAVTAALETITFGDDNQLKKDYVRLTGSIPLEGVLKEGSGFIRLEYTNKDKEENYADISLITVIDPDKVYADYIYGSGENKTFYGWMYLLDDYFAFDDSKFTLILKDLLGNIVFTGNLTLGEEQEEYYGFLERDFTVTLPDGLANSFYVFSIKYDGKDIYDFYAPEKLVLSRANVLKFIYDQPLPDSSLKDNDKVIGIRVSGAKEDTTISAELYDKSDIDNFNQIAAITLVRDNDVKNSYYFTGETLEGVDLSQEYQIVYLCNGVVLIIDDDHMLSYADITPSENAFDHTKVTARTAIEEAITAGTASSATVAIMDNGKLIYAEGFGMADREKNIAVNKDTVFNIGSVSKMFAATSIMLLVDEGKVALDEPVTIYLPEFTMADERYKDITVRMLLNHSSGLPGSTFWNNLGFEYNQNIYEELLACLSRSTLKHRPGELAAYCNDGFTLAEMIVARVTGKSYGDFLAERIFEPLTVNHTSLGVGLLPEGVTPARFYRPDGKSEPLEIVSLLASGGLSSTAEDLCRFAASFSDHLTILSAQSQMEMLKRQPSEFQGKLRGDSWSPGLGWDYADITAFSDENLRLYGKSGGTGHYAAMLYTVPSQRISVAVIASGAQCDSPGIALNILSAYLKEKGLITAEEQEAKEPIEAQPVPSELMVYEGYYCASGEPCRIALDDEKDRLTLYVVDGSNESALFTAVYNDGFFCDGEKNYYFTTADGTGYFVEYNSKFNLHLVIAEKLQPPADPPELSIPMDARVWLRRNVKATETAMLLPTHIVSSSQTPALPGYVNFFGMKTIKSPDYAGMPVKSMRDLTELRLVEQNGATWAWLSGADYMPAGLAQPLNTGANILTIGSEGRNEWLKVDFAATLSFEVPAKGRVIVFGAEGILYDSLVDSGGISVPGGSLIEVAGNPGELFKVMTSGNTHEGSGKGKNPQELPAPVIPETVTPSAGMFTDIADYSWAGEAITALAEKGIIKGISDTSFAPANQITRADYMLLMVRLLGVTADVEGNFGDVAENEYYYKEIGIAKALGLTTGIDGANFHPEVSITRQDMFLLAYRIMQQQGLIKTEVDLGVLNQFSDSAEISQYAKEALATLISMDLVKGSENMINPKGNATRAETAVFIYRLLSLL
ncbi:MAG: beta-lactamase family protein [Desulfotomaculaceae bacterium]|nr:beta-lactamase family protein [Desulfotomaculaceae bacterium]